MNINNPLELLSIQIFGFGLKVFLEKPSEQADRRIAVEVNYVVGKWSSTDNE